jgi:HKD family nuclease
MIFAGGPGKSLSLGETVEDAVSSCSSPRLVRSGFAYITETGLETFLRGKSTDDWRELTESKWIVGLDQGITEPAALRELRSPDNAEARVYIPGGTLSKKALTSRPRFHAKTVSIESYQNPSQRHLLVSSSNLTRAALGGTPTNYELGLAKSVAEGLTPEEVKTFDKWWESIWEDTQPITDDLIEQYKGLRDEINEQNPALEKYESSELVEHASDGRCLWIETEEMTGGSRNQMEFSDELSGFFTRPSDDTDQVIIKFGGSVHDDRPLNIRTTDPPYGVQICKLGLPTGYNYRNKVVHLQKVLANPSEKPKYKLSVRNKSHTDVDEWKQLSRNNGVLGETGGGREFGYY